MRDNNPPIKSQEVPITQIMLYEVRNELKSDVASVNSRVGALEKETKSGFLQFANEFKKVQKQFEQVDQKFEQVDQRFEQIDQRFEQIDQRFEQVDQRFEQIDQRFEQIDQRFEQIDQRFEQVDHRFQSLELNLDAKFDRLESKISDLSSVAHRTLALVEEQESRNRYVLDGYAYLRDRQDRFEKDISGRMNILEKKVLTK